MQHGEAGNVIGLRETNIKLNTFTYDKPFFIRVMCTTHSSTLELLNSTISFHGE